jgi:hypothetical protein
MRVVHHALTTVYGMSWDYFESTEDNAQMQICTNSYGAGSLIHVEGAGYSYWTTPTKPSICSNPLL